MVSIDLDLELNTYNSKLKDLTTINYNTRSISNKELSFFIKTTSYNKYLENKDINKLLDLLYFTYPKFYTYIYNSIIDIGIEINNIIKLLPTNIRALLKNAYLSNKATNNPIDSGLFIPLESKTTRGYFKEFSLLVIYLLELYIKKTTTLPKDKDFTLYYTYPILSSSLLDNLEKIFNLGEPYYKGLDISSSLKVLLLKLFYTLLKEELEYSLDKDSNFSNPLITYLILRSINSKTTLFREETYIQNLLSKLIYNSRLYYLGYIEYLLKENLIDNFTLRITKELKELLVVESNNYFSTIYTLRNTLRRFNYRRISAYKPILDKGNDSLRVDNIPIKIGTLKTLFSNLLLKVESILYIDLLHFNSKSKDNSILELNILRIEDSIENNIPLENITTIDSYLKSISNKDLLIKRLYNPNTKLNNYLMLDKVNFNLKNVKSFLKTRDLFIKNLLLAFYLLSSSPLRGEELTLLRYSNTREGGLRNLYFDKSLNTLSINTSYSKTSNTNTINLSNIRFLPIRLTRVVLYYLVYYIPLYNYLNIKVIKNNNIISPYLFTIKNKEIRSNILSNTLYKETSLYFSKGLGLKLYRHLIVYIIKEFIVKDRVYLLSPNKRNTTTYKGSLKESKIEDILSNHSTRLVEANYARESNLFSNKTKSIYTRSKDFTLLYFNFFNLTKDKDINSILEELEDKRLKEDNSNLDLDLEAITSSSNSKDSSSTKSSTKSRSRSTSKGSIISSNNSIAKSSSRLSKNSSKKSTFKEGLSKLNNLKVITISSSKSSNSTYISSINSPTTRLSKSNLERLEKETSSISNSSKVYSKYFSLPTKTILSSLSLDYTSSNIESRNSILNTYNPSLDLDLYNNSLKSKSRSSKEENLESKISSLSIYKDSSSIELPKLSRDIDKERSNSILSSSKEIPNTSSIASSISFIDNLEEEVIPNTYLEEDYIEDNLDIPTLEGILSKTIEKGDLDNTLESSSKVNTKALSKSNSTTSSSSIVLTKKDSKKRGRGRPKKIKTRGRPKRS